MSGAIPEGLRTYLSNSLFQADGATLKPGVDADKAIEVAKGVQAKAGAMPPAEAKLFLAMIGAADMAPGANGKIPADIDKTIASLASSAALVANLSISSNSLDFLARAMIEQSAEQRKNALNDRLSAREIAKGELLNQAGKLKDEADKLSSSALTSMIVTVVMSAVSIGASALSVIGSVGSAVRGGAEASKMTKAMDLANADAVAKGGTQTFSKADKMMQAMKASTESTTVKVASSVSQGLGTLGQTANQLGQGVSGYISADGQAAGKRLEAEGQINAAQAQEAQAVGDVRKEAQQSLDQMVQSIIQFLKDLKDSKAQQMQALTRV